MDLRREVSVVCVCVCVLISTPLVFIAVMMLRNVNNLEKIMTIGGNLGEK